MKKTIVCVLLLLSIASFAACGKKEKKHLACKNCGEEISFQTKFCPSCGTAVNDSKNDSESKDNENHEENVNDIQNPELIKERIKIYGTYIRVNSANGVSMYIEWENLSEKEIKYMNFNVELYNRVGDKLSCEITRESNKWISQTGPIPRGKGMYNCISSSLSGGAKRPFRPDATSDEYNLDKQNGWEGRYWDCIWYNSQAYYAKVVGVRVEYMDGTTFSETNKSIFENLEIVTLNVNDEISNHIWNYPTTAKLVAKNFPYSNGKIRIDSLLVDKVIGSEENQALFVCKLKGYNYSGFSQIYVDAVDGNGNIVDDLITDIFVSEQGEFTSWEFYVTTPIDGTYYLVIDSVF